MNYFEKKQWIRLGICAVLLIAASLFLTGIIGGEHMTYMLPAAGTPAEETVQGFHGPVTVHVMLDGKTVIALTVDTPDETEGIGKKASEEDFTGQFIGKEGPFTFGENGVDAISGATITSRAVLRALNKAITGEDVEPEGTDATSGATAATDATSGATETAGSGTGTDATSGATETAGSGSGTDATSGATETAGSGTGTDATSGATEPAGSDAVSGATETSGQTGEKNEGE